MIPRYFCNKLFGGPRNGQRVAHSDNPQGYCLSFPVFSRLHSGLVSEWSLAHEPYKAAQYTLREFGGQQGTVRFYAYSKLTDAEACDRFWRFAMRSTKSELET